MNEQDKTFQQAIEELQQFRATLSEEELFKQVLALGPVIQQAVRDGRSIQPVVAQYFPADVEREAVASIYYAALLRTIIDNARARSEISDVLYKDLLRFIQALVPKEK